MFKLKFKTTLIAAVIASLLLTGFVVKSDAASITSMSASVPDDWGSGANVAIHLSTDEGISFIDWSKNGTYETTTLHNGATSVDVHFSLPGNIKGEKYEISAVVSFVESSDADASHTFRVYKPEVDNDPFEGVYGAAYLYRITYDGDFLSMSGYISGYHTTNIDRVVSGKYRLTVKKNGVEIARPEELAPGATLEQGDNYSDSGGPSHFIGMIDDGDTYSANGYVRIFVGAPSWKAEETASFTDDDNP